MKQKKRLLIFLPFLTYGGAERQGYLLAEGLQRQYNYEVEVWGFSLPGSNYPLAADLQKAGVKTRVLPFTMNVFRSRKNTLATLWQYTSLLRDAKFDAVIPFTYWPNFLTAIAARFVGAKCFWNQRSVDDHVAPGKWENLFAFNKLTKVSNSNSGREFLCKRFNLQPNDIYVVPNAVVQLTPAYDAAYWSQSLQIDSADLVLTMVANFFPEKNFTTVIEGVKILKERKRKVVCIFCGGGGNHVIEKAAKAQAFDLQLQDSIRFVGSTADVAGILSVTDVGILSTLSEGCPNSILEYMMASIPIVASDINPIRDVLGDYPYLFSNNSAEDFANKVETLASDKNLRTSTGEMLKEKVKKEFSLEKMLDTYDSLIKTS